MAALVRVGGEEGLSVLIEAVLGWADALPLLHDPGQGAGRPLRLFQLVITAADALLGRLPAARLATTQKGTLHACHRGSP